MSADAPQFVNLDHALKLHDYILVNYGGGMPGVRDRDLLESAIAAPQAAMSFGYLRAFPWEMAAAYLFHIARNHPFVDGNKRTALICMLTFLEMNDSPVQMRDAEKIDLACRAAKGEINAEDIAAFLQGCAEKKS